jgi:hypothetical protein
MANEIVGVTIYQAPASRQVSCVGGAVVCSWFLLILEAQRARYQAETPLIALCKFFRPALNRFVYFQHDGRRWPWCRAVEIRRTWKSRPGQFPEGVVFTGRRSRSARQSLNTPHCRWIYFSIWTGCVARGSEPNALRWWREVQQSPCGHWRNAHA